MESGGTNALDISRKMAWTNTRAGFTEVWIFACYWQEGHRYLQRIIMKHSTPQLHKEGNTARGADVCQTKACGNGFDVTRKERTFEQVRRKDRSHGHKVGHLSS